MIELDGVTHRFGDRTVLDDVTLTLSERRVGLIGANGSGKSTLARTVNGLIRPDAGTVRVNGLDVRRETARVRRAVGFMFTDASAQVLMPTVAEDLQLSLRDQPISAQEKDSRLTEMLRFAGLEGHRDHPAQLLSGGQQQMLAFASVLIRRPDVLVCDEPSTLLDLRHLHRLRQTLAALPQQVVLLTHHLDLLDDFDRVVVLDAGAVVADGPPVEAIRAYTELMAARP